MPMKKPPVQHEYDPEKWRELRISGDRLETYVHIINHLVDPPASVTYAGEQIKKLQKIAGLWPEQVESLQQFEQCLLWLQMICHKIEALSDDARPLGETAENMKSEALLVSIFVKQSLANINKLFTEREETNGEQSP